MPPSLIVLPHNIVDGHDLQAEPVMDNINEVKNKVNGNLGNIHLASDAGITGDRLAPGTVPNSKLGVDCVTETKIADAAVQAEHQKADLSATPGTGCNLSALVSSHASYGNAPNAHERGGFTLWGWLEIQPLTDYQAFTFDASGIDWRQRIIKVTLISHEDDTVSIGEYLPGNAREDKMRVSIENNNPGTATIDIGMGFLAGGTVNGVGAPPAEPYLMLNVELGSPSIFDEVYLFAGSATGNLVCQTSVVDTLAFGASLIFHIEASPRLVT